MKVITVALSAFLAAGFIQTALGKKCDTGCAACWKDGQKGVDTKFSCSSANNQCGDTCPSGYSKMHCAKHARCFCTNVRGDVCKVFGPCICGVSSSSLVQTCKPIKSDGTCQTS